MCTVRIVIPRPGTFAPIASETPSSGWMWMSSTFGRRPSAAVSSKGGCGARLNWIAIVAPWARDRPAFPNYAAGTWGPHSADELIHRDGRSWRRH